MNTDNQTVKSNKTLKKVLIILVIALAVIIGIVVTFSVMGRPYDKTNNSYKTIEIAENSGNEDIASILHKEGIIGKESTFLTLTSLLNHGDEYQSGTYYLSPSMSFRELAYTLINGISTKTGFTIPAGYTVEQIASSLQQAGICNAEDFLNAASNIDLSMFDFIDNSVSGTSKIEGFLLPGKYDIGEDVSAEMIIITMLNEFDNSFNAEYRNRTDELGLSIKDVVIIASIIENATSVEKEKSRISSVIHNKLNLNSEFEDGYPTVPLCSPSADSIKAALYPEDTQYLYYVPSSKLDGTHVFTSDRKEYYSFKEAYDTAVAEKKAAQEKEKADQ